MLFIRMGFQRRALFYLSSMRFVWYTYHIRTCASPWKFLSIAKCERCYSMCCLCSLFGIRHSTQTFQCKVLFCYTLVPFIPYSHDSSGCIITDLLLLIYLTYLFGYLDLPFPFSLSLYSVCISFSCTLLFLLVSSWFVWFFRVSAAWMQIYDI